MKNLLLVPAILLVGSLPASADFCFDLTGLTSGTGTIVVGSTTIQLTTTVSNPDGSAAGLTSQSNGLGANGSSFFSANDKVDGGAVPDVNGMFGSLGESIEFTLAVVGGPGGTIEINEVDLFGFNSDEGPSPSMPGDVNFRSLFEVTGNTTDTIDGGGNPTGLTNHGFADMGTSVTFQSRGFGATFNKLYFDFTENSTGGGGGGAAIPEPSSFALCLLCGCFGLRRRKKRPLV